jgi:iron complex transport system substrate-binding protein
LLSGCAEKLPAGNSLEEGYTFTDALGNEITVHNPQRVIALMGSFAETWMLAGGELVGVTDDALEERGLALPENISSVGKYNSPNVEKMIGLEPDMVILSAETQAHAALQGVLADAGITAAYFSVTHFDDYLAMLEVCTEITGRKDLYEKNGVMVEQQIDTVIAGAENQDPPSVAFLITYSGGAAVQDSGSMTGKMLKDLGCENIADETPSLLNEFSMESLIAADPDYIFVVPMGNDDELAMKNLRESIEANPAWSGLSAVKNNRYILLPKGQFLYKPNAKWAESYAYLSEILYGER